MQELQGRVDLVGAHDRGRTQRLGRPGRSLLRQRGGRPKHGCPTARLLGGPGPHGLFEISFGDGVGEFRHRRQGVRLGERNRVVVARAVGHRRGEGDHVGDPGCRRSVERRGDHVHGGNRVVRLARLFGQVHQGGTPFDRLGDRTLPEVEPNRLDFRHRRGLRHPIDRDDAIDVWVRRQLTKGASTHCSGCPGDRDCSHRSTMPL